MFLYMFVEGTCHKPKDTWYCGSYWPVEYCTDYPTQVPYVCPYMCGIC